MQVQYVAGEGEVEEGQKAVRKQMCMETSDRHRNKDKNKSQSAANCVYSSLPRSTSLCLSLYVFRLSVYLFPSRPMLMS